jgi:hypothetical protein
MWGLLPDKVLPEYHLAKARSVLKVFATTKSMAQSNDMGCRKGTRFGRDDQVAKQVHIVVWRSARFSCAPPLRHPAQHSLERSLEMTYKAITMHIKYQLCTSLFAVKYG